MKKIFTLIGVALCAMSMNAQTEKYMAVDEDGNIAPEFAAAVLDDGKLTATISTPSTSLKAVAGSTPANVSGGAQDINPDGTVNSWADPAFNGPKNHGDTGFWWIEGTGNPFVGIGAEEIVTDSEGTGTYRATYTYYSPDGSLGLPLTGFYIEFSASQAGMFKVKFWNNKGGSRELFIVDTETAKALTPMTEYKAEGYVNGQKNDDGTMKFFPEFPIGSDTAPYLIDPDHANGSVRLGWLVFDATPGKKYMVFGKDWQFGFSGYEFIPGATIANYTATDPNGGTNGIANVKAELESNAPIYNMAGQKVGRDYKGVKIQNGRKFM